MEVKAGYLYNRKDALTATPFGTERTAHNINYDDMVLQMTIRIDNPRKRYNTKPLEEVIALEAAIITFNLEAARAKLEAEITAEDAAAETARAAAAKKREQLAKLRQL